MAVTTLVSRVWSKIFNAVFAIGLLWQLASIINLYFQYRVSTSTSVFTHEVIEPLSIILCVKISHVFDLNRLNKDLGSNYIKNEQGLIEDFKNLTLENIFEYTPSTDILESLKFKTKNKTMLVEYEQNVQDEVNVTKFIHRNDVCYKIVVKEDEPLDYREVSVTSAIQFYVKMLKFRQSIENSSAVKVMLDHVEGFPYEALISTPHHSRRLFEINGVAFTDFNEYHVNHMVVVKSKLPSPYESNCFDYKAIKLQDRHHCMEQCVSSQVWNFLGKVSLLSPVTQSNKSGIFSLHQLKEDDENKTFWKIQTRCQSIECKKVECYDNQVVSFTIPISYTKKGFTKDNNNEHNLYSTRQLNVKHKIIPQISFRITSTPTLSFIEFVVYILGTLSTWTGLSIFVCNPANLGQYLTKPGKIRLTFIAEQRFFRIERIPGNVQNRRH